MLKRIVVFLGIGLFVGCVPELVPGEGQLPIEELVEPGTSNQGGTPMGMSPITVVKPGPGTPSGQQFHKPVGTARIDRAQSMASNVGESVIADDKTDRWTHADDPNLFSTDLEYRLTELPMEGTAANAPWASSYWPVYQDSINYSWEGPDSLSPAAKYGAAFGVDDIEDRVSAYYGVDRHSWNTSCTNNSDCDEETTEVCAKRRGEESGYCIPTWWGICHAWAPASILEPEPIAPVTINGVEFKVNDLKAIMSLLYNKTTVRFVSLRCNENNDADEIEYDAYDRPTGEDLECKDTNPGTYHVLLANYLGLQQRSFVEDRTFDAEVWNQPLRGYRITLMEEVDGKTANGLVGMTLETHPDGIPEIYAFNDDAAFLYLVKSEVDYITEAASSMDGNLSGYIDLYTRTDHYHYLLEVDVDGKVIGGEWIGPSKSSHPDFLWLPLNRRSELIAGTVIRYEVIKEIFDTSISENTDDNIANIDFVTAEVPQGTWKHYGPYEAAEGEVHVRLSGTEDADLYVHMGSEPTSSVYTCRPYETDSDEVCTLTGPGSVYVSVYGYHASNVELLVRYPELVEVPVEVPEPVVDPDLPEVLWPIAETGELEKTEWAHFGPFTVASGTLTATMTGTGDADLYVRMGAEPTTADFDCRPYGGSSNENCTIDGPGDVYVSVRGYRTSAFDLTIDFVAAVDVPVTEPEPEAEPEPESEGLDLSMEDSVDAGAWIHYGPYEVAAGTLTATLTGSGDADLYVRMGEEPTTTSYDCRPYSASSNENCAIDGPGVIYVSVRGYSAAEFNLNIQYAATATAEGETVVVPGNDEDPVDEEGTVSAGNEVEHLYMTGTVAQGEMKLYSLVVPAGANVRVFTTAPNDVDLYLKAGSAPTVSDYEMRGYTTSGNESLEYTATEDLVLEIGVHGYRASSFSLRTEDL